MTTIKLKAPNELPEDGLSSVAFEAWQNQTISFLEQEVFHYEFVSGKYTEWTAKQETEDGKRISTLAAQDPEKKIIDAKTGPGAEDAKPGELDTLLIKRNSQLSKFLQLIANLCQYSEQSDILTSSTSLSWIWENLKRRYNIESRGSHLLDVASINPKPDQLPLVFYKQFKSRIFNNLRKKGDKVIYKGGKRLAEDEIISPTFASIIMMWALEKLDLRLPAKVKKDFGFRMEGDITLIDLETAVFQAVPGMIEELDGVADIKAATVTGDAHPSLAAAGYRFPRNQGFRGRGTMRPFRPPFSRGGQGRGGQTRGGQTGRTDASKGSCRICRLAGKSESVYKSHHIGNCYFFTEKDQKDLMSGLNSLQLEDAVDTGPDSPYYGWEDEEGENVDQDG